MNQEIINYDPEKNWAKNPMILQLIGLGSPYFIKTPWWLQKFYSSYTWKIKTKEPVIYLTFDDGPNLLATPFVLDELKKFNAKATFFCIGKNVLEYPALYSRILEEGHAVGNHTQNHLNGWKTGDEEYLIDVAQASNHIASNLFRPPYGRITSFQAKNLSHAIKSPDPVVIMWTVLSADFDTALSKKKCLEHVILNAGKGSIVVYHDSEKAFPNLGYSLPLVLRHFSEKGFRFESLTANVLK